MPEPLPYFKWYWRDFRGNRKVQRMNHVERGLYRDLLDEQWDAGWIPDDITKLADICGCSVEVMTAAWPSIQQCFVPLEDDPTKLINPRLERERTASDAKRANLARAGRQGAIAKQASTNAKQLPANAGRCHIAEQSSSRAEQPDVANAAKCQTDGYDSAFDGQEAFTTTVDLFPEKDGGRLLRDYSHRAQLRHQEAIAEIQQSLSCSASEATEWLKGKIREYLADAKPGFHKSFHGFLDSKPWRNTPAETNGAAPPGFAWFRDGDERVLLPV